MSVIPEFFIRDEVLRLESLVSLLADHEARGGGERDAVGVANTVLGLIPSFESIRVAAKAELDSGTRTEATLNQYHAQIDEIEGEIQKGLLLVIPNGKGGIEADSYAEKWLWAVQLSFGIHYISHVRSGSMGGPVILGHGSKTCIPPHSC